MSLSARVLRELITELQDLNRTRDAAIERIAAIETIVAPRLSRDDKSRAVGRTPSMRGKSLRAMVLQTLQHPSGLSASEVTSHLQQQGFRVGGSTTLRERVAHELSRLRRKGVVRRLPDGEYVIALQGDVRLPEEMPEAADRLKQIDLHSTLLSVVNT